MAATSQNNTIIVAGSSAAITDTYWNVWAINATGQVVFNGVAQTGTSAVSKLAFVNGDVWQLNTFGNWYPSIVTQTVTWGAPTTVSPIGQPPMVADP